EGKTYCVYLAPDEEVLRERSQLAGFPTHRVSRITQTIDPTTGE
ncbi:MAG: nickel-binding protein, partial [Gammaproteobacteria bacterium]